MTGRSIRKLLLVAALKTAPTRASRETFVLANRLANGDTSDGVLGRKRLRCAMGGDGIEPPTSCL